VEVKSKQKMEIENWTVIGAIAVIAFLLGYGTNAIIPLQAVTDGVVQVLFPETKLGYNIELREWLFWPQSYLVREGDTVTIRNGMEIDCEFMSDAEQEGKEALFPTTILKPGDQITIQFKEGGTYGFHCHPYIHVRGEVVVA